MKTIYFFLALFICSSSYAGKVLIIEPEGGGSSARKFVSTLEKELASHEVVTQPRPSSWKGASKKTTGKLAVAIQDANADVGIDGDASKKSFFAVVVDNKGEVIFEKTAKLPKKKPEKEIVSLAKAAAKAALKELNKKAAKEEEPIARSDTGKTDNAPTPAASATSEEDPFAAGADDGGLPSRPKTKSETLSAEPSDTSSTSVVQPAKTELSPTLTTETKSSRSKSDGGFHLLFRLGGGLIGFRDTINTPTPGGDLDLKLNSTLNIGGGLEAYFTPWLGAEVRAHRHAARLSHNETITPKTIDIAQVGGAFFMKGLYSFGSASLAAHLGGSFDAQSATAQSPTLLVPAWSHMVAWLGASFRYGTPTTSGLVAEVGVLAAPWGTHKEKPLTSGDTSKILGGSGWLRLRYQLPKLLGSAGGIFVEGEGQGEYLKISYKGDGSRTTIDGGTRVQASEETRLQYGFGLNVGYIF